MHDRTTFLEAFRAIPHRTRPWPFSFVFDGRVSDEFLDGWRCEIEEEQLDADRTRLVARWTDPKTGLRVHCETTRYADFPAVEWLLRFENTGKADTPIIENVQSLDLFLEDPMTDYIERPTYDLDHPYWLTKTNGAPANDTDFAVRRTHVNPWTERQPGINDQRFIRMSGEEGRSSNKDFPFFKIETGSGSLIAAIGWSGQWQTRIRVPFAINNDPKQILWPKRQPLWITAGLETCHFRLHPGEKVRMPRILLFFWKGETLESNAQFRQLIYRHYTPTRAGKKPLPTLFCNTFYTRCTDKWLNDCNAENQIPLVKAYAKLGAEAVITDAGWYETPESGWGSVGTWRVDHKKYPQGMAPLAAAAKEGRTIYGLWFEPERTVPGTELHREHPDWLLPAGPGPQTAYMVNFGLPAVQDYFFRLVKQFMDMPGFRVYRQDFNHPPLDHWKHNEPPDRQGITEMKYIEGLYAFWDRIAERWPDSLRQECAGGGRRIDLETVMRMHLHQDSDCHLVDEIDQSQVWGLSQYLPNNVFTTALTQLDDYSFHTALPHSISLGWPADAPDFDWARARHLVQRYRELRHLFIGAWYPLLPASVSPQYWMASQYHRPDLNEGIVLVFRRSESPFPIADLSLHGLQAEATYELQYETSGERGTATGAILMNQLRVTLPQKRSSELIVYRRIGTSHSNATRVFP